MRLGGVSYDGVCPLTCDIPDPKAPGWKLVTDPDGCLAWQRPVAPFACILDASTDASSDAATDAASDSDATVLDVCTPASVASFKPSAMNPPRAPTASCSNTELGTFWDACFGPNVTTTSCQTFLTSQTACVQCLVSQYTDSTWGALVVEGNSYYGLNVGGCVDILQNDSSPTSCGARLLASWECEGVACANCYDEPEVVYEQCYQEAAANGCRAYTDKECDPADGGFAQCIFDGSKASLVSVASVFCGP